MSAIRLWRIDSLMDALGELVAGLQASYGLPRDFYEQQVEGKTGWYRWDLYNLLDTIPDHSYDYAVTDAIGKVRRLLAHPHQEREKIPSELRLSHHRSGNVQWSIDDWSTQETAALEGPDLDGQYRARIQAFKPGVLKVQYRFQYEDGQVTQDHSQIRHRDYAYSSRFPSNSPLVAEGHTRAGMRGFSIAVLDPFSYNDNHFLYHQMRLYGELAFTKSTYGKYLYSRYESFWTWMRWDEIRSKSTKVQLIWRRGHPLLLYRDLEGRFTATESVTPRIVKRGKSLVLVFHCKKNGRILPFSNCPLTAKVNSQDGENMIVSFSERRTGRPLDGLSTSVQSILNGPAPAYVTKSALKILRPFVKQRSTFLLLHPEK